jgi:TldD protein
MTVVLSGRAGGTMIHEAIGHGLEGDAVFKGLSIYSGRLGEKIASDHVTVIDDATLEGKRGSYRFDDEGTPSQRTVAVEDGVLKGFLLDRRSAAKLGMEPTGNGRRENFRFRPIVRMSNTMIAPGEHDPEEIIAGVKSGLLVVRMGGGQVDTSSGDFVFKVAEAYLIENGRVTEPVRGATLIGNGPAVLETVDMVGNDIGFDIGTCGKDGQHVPVSDAQPTIRIPGITVGGEVG